MSERKEQICIILGGYERHGENMECKAAVVLEKISTMINLIVLITDVLEKNNPQIYINCGHLIETAIIF